jgi:hypothetical protein
MKRRGSDGADLETSDLKHRILLSMLNVMKGQPWQMKHPAVIVFAICVMSLLSFSRVEATSNGPIAPGSSTAGTLEKVDDSALKNDVVGQALTVPPGSSTPSNLFRDIPSISGDSPSGGTKLTPYIGAGFGSGYASDLDRSLSGRSFTQTDSGPRSHFGQGLTPSEFQMGIRIPF